MPDARAPSPGTSGAPEGGRAPRYADRGDGWTLATELLTATFVWGGIGWLGDRWLDTAPVLMVVGFVVGNALGVYLIWIRSQDRFTLEHAQLMAQRARTRQPPGAPPPRDGGAPDPVTPPATAADGQPRWRRVRVRVQRPDVSVRSREGFYWPRPAAPE